MITIQAVSVFVVCFWCCQSYVHTWNTRILLSILSYSASIKKVKFPLPCHYGILESGPYFQSHRHVKVWCGRYHAWLRLPTFPDFFWVSVLRGWAEPRAFSGVIVPEKQSPLMGLEHNTIGFSRSSPNHSTNQAARWWWWLTNYRGCKLFENKTQNAINDITVISVFFTTWPSLYTLAIKGS